MIRKKLMPMITLWLSLLVLSTNVHAISIVEKNQLPAFLSFDYSGVLLGLEYGIDPTFPDLTITGTITASGFNWTGGGIYFGDPVVWTSTGIYDPLNNSLHWTGSGSYVGKPWTMSGDIKWVSDVSFLIAHQYWIGFPITGGQKIGQNGRFESRPIQLGSKHIPFRLSELVTQGSMYEDSDSSSR
jgi:hypothetical protein